MDNLANSIQREIFVASWDLPLGPERKRFRADHREHLDLLDELERFSNVIVDHDRYYIHFLNLPEIMKNTPQAEECLNICEKIFLFLRGRYEENTDERIAIDSIVKQTNISRDKVIKVMRYIGQASVLSAWTTNMHEEDATVVPAESILRHDSFSEIIEEVRGWRSKSIKAYQASAPMNIGDESIPSLSWLLHPAVSEQSLKLFENGHLREAVLNSIMTVFHLIQVKTGLEEDGEALVGKALSLENPYLILTELNSESGRNDQKGFMRILQGSYQGIRNPKAHRLTHNLTKTNAAQYLVFASLLARRIDEARLVDGKHQGVE